MNNVFRIALAGTTLALAAFGAAQSHGGGRGHGYDNGYGYGGRRSNPPKALDHQFLDLFRGRGHLAQDRRNYEHQQRDRYGYGRGYDDHGGYGNRGGHGGRDNHGYSNGGYGYSGGHGNRRGH